MCSAQIIVLNVLFVLVYLSYIFLQSDDSCSNARCSFLIFKHGCRKRSCVSCRVLPTIEGGLKRSYLVYVCFEVRNKTVYVVFRTTVKTIGSLTLLIHLLYPMLLTNIQENAYYAYTVANQLKSGQRHQICVQVRNK